MEVLRRTSKSGKVYRIVDDGNYFVHLYVIEFCKVYAYDDGTECEVWKPAYEPKNKIFSSLEECKDALEAFLQN